MICIRQISGPKVAKHCTFGSQHTYAEDLPINPLQQRSNWITRYTIYISHGPITRFILCATDAPRRSSLNTTWSNIFLLTKQNMFKPTVLHCNNGFSTDQSFCETQSSLRCLHNHFLIPVGLLSVEIDCIHVNRFMKCGWCIQASSSLYLPRLVVMLTYVLQP